MTPLLYQQLNIHCPEAVPRETLEQLRERFRANARRNLSLTSELLHLLDLLAATGIRAIPFKGPVLTFCVYGSLALREFIDLDILVSPQDVPRVRELLVSRSYRPVLELGGTYAEALVQSEHAETFISEDGRCNLDVHWAFAARPFTFPLDLEVLWGVLEHINLSGRDIPTLPPQELILVLCVHGSKHQWARLGWICDIAQVVRVRQDIDWEQLMRRARMLGTGRSVLLGLLLASQLLQAPVPQEILERAQADRHVKFLARQVTTSLFEGVERPPGRLEQVLFNLRAKERLEDKVRYCVLLATTPDHRDWAWAPLPRLLWFLYPVLRPLRLFMTYVLPRRG